MEIKLIDFVSGKKQWDDLFEYIDEFLRSKEKGRFDDICRGVLDMMIESDNDEDRINFLHSMKAMRCPPFKFIETTWEEYQNGTKIQIDELIRQIHIHYMDYELEDYYPNMVLFCKECHSLLEEVFDKSNKLIANYLRESSVLEYVTVYGISFPQDVLKEIVSGVLDLQKICNCKETTTYCGKQSCSKSTRNSVIYYKDSDSKDYEKVTEPGIPSKGRCRECIPHGFRECINCFIFTKRTCKVKECKVPMCYVCRQEGGQDEHDWHHVNRYSTT